ncbi:HIT-like domain-containing protein [Rhypophila decipiens]|uniref:Bis(5'-adenosyl)-triphosphatase n=1 Tax=Rhypophila decipiens TaxID=261697 RepID=A0AAN6Y1M7_9PEZI|nr:HIT-like domain-containing protein [Rhypophila decipiens]
MDDSTTTTSNGSSKHNSKTDRGEKPIYFGPFEVTNQVFLTTPHSFALVNLKPLLPGHVLVCPLRRAKRLTDLSAVEITDLFSSVQKVQRMLARYYFSVAGNNSHHDEKGNGQEEEELCAMGSFNIAVQDGPEAGQTVSHVHVHVIPRIKGSTAKDVETPSDELYDRMAGEDGNVGGAHWDRLHHRNQNHETTRDMDGASRRPEPGGQFPSIEDSQRVARGMEEMEAEAEVFREVLRGMELDGMEKDHPRVNQNGWPGRLPG